MNWLIHPIEALKGWGVKKFVLKIVNTTIAKYNDSIQAARAYLSRYRAKVAALLKFFDSLNAKLADGKLTEAEADAICDEATTLAKELTA